MSPCGTVPTPRPPHQLAWASVETPIAPATWAAQPSPVCTSQWSWRAGEERDCLAVGRAAAGRREPVVVAGGEEEDLLAVGRRDDLVHVAHDQGAAGQAAEVDGLQ